MLDAGSSLLQPRVIICNHSLQIVFGSSCLQCTAAEAVPFQGSWPRTTAMCSYWLSVFCVTWRGDWLEGLFLPSTSAFPRSVPYVALLATLFLSLAGTNTDVPKPVEVFENISFKPSAVLKSTLFSSVFFFSKDKDNTSILCVFSLVVYRSLGSMSYQVGAARISLPHLPALD